MKIFLLSSVMAMLAAGIYGTVDLTLDIKNGTLIQYEEEEPVTMGRFISKSARELKSLKLQAAEKKQIENSTMLLPDLSLSDFSRGEPPMIFENLVVERLIEKAGFTDSLKNAGVDAALSDTLIALNKEVIQDSAQKPEPGKPIEVRKLNARLFSRSKPRYYTKEVAVDSVKADKAQN